MDYVIESDKRGTYVIEGEKKPDKTFVIKRFICQIQEQETPEETQEVAEMVLYALTRT